jgi:hypothetical protein
MMGWLIVFVMSLPAGSLAQTAAGGSITVLPVPRSSGDDNVGISQGILRGKPLVLRITFPAVIPGDGSEVFGSVKWLDLKADIVSIDMVDVVCPPNFTCNFGEIPVSSNSRVGTEDFFIFCDNRTADTVTFVVDFVPIDVNGEGRSRSLSYRCTPS